ncbi:MAG: transposase family protein [Chloroflexota bacterium]
MGYQERMDVERIVGNAVALRALTGLDRGEFDRLVARLDEALRHATRRNWRGEPRQRARGAGPKSCLPTTAHKLFFLLFYYKVYPIQHAMAALFGVAQSGVCEWLHYLTPLVQNALGRAMVRPARRAKALEEVLREHSHLVGMLDGTERPVRRPTDPDAQRRHYSGKKKRHTRKNLVVSAARRVRYLGATAAGTQHDKSLADQARLRWPPGTRLVADSGFAGYTATGAGLLRPFKKRRGQTLEPFFRQWNRQLARLRVGVEHVLAGVKRCRIVADTLRNWRAGFADAAMEIACGLHNLREDVRRPGLA